MNYINGFMAITGYVLWGGAIIGTIFSLLLQKFFPEGGEKHECIRVERTSHHSARHFNAKGDSVRSGGGRN